MTPDDPRIGGVRVHAIRIAAIGTAETVGIDVTGGIGTTTLAGRVDITVSTDKKSRTVLLQVV